MKKNITVAEIAKLAEVSPAAVSLVLNGKSGVGSETRERILRIARENSYKGLEGGVPRKKRKALLFVNIVKHGQILNENHKAFIADYIDGAQMKAGSKGYSLEVTAFPSFNPSEVVSYLNSSGADGAIILGTELDEGDITHFLKVHIPLVFIDLLYPHMPFDFVDMNNDSSVYNAVSHLVRMGHREIGIVTGRRETSNFAHRKRSFVKSLELSGLKADEMFFFTADSRYEDAYRDMREILASGVKMPSALFCVNDIIAMGCVRALKEKGYSVPEDVSVVGFDNLPATSMTEPPLTTVSVSKKKISSKAVSLLTQRIKEGSRMPYEKIMIGGEVIERKSVKRLANFKEDL
ncbi:LacI family transcriptional regulator [Geovibrio thiophilus]|uniref:LacI family transcriptional regulator n=1 Tax=Geovibrio thiophilus TaxID=139438 RepID=A0A410JZ94_9BACT|nr:LacI family DNA-binding transcriptional regulator [Geovibrio thiophilus]QAR33487.1 LacI family transcriptional regulator [Geovibrio thiophilus]